MMMMMMMMIILIMIILNIQLYYIYTDNSENVICSLYELIYSYRDEKDESDIPPITSENSIAALNILNELKNELSSGKMITKQKKTIITSKLIIYNYSITH